MTDKKDALIVAQQLEIQEQKEALTKLYEAMKDIHEALLDNYMGFSPKQFNYLIVNISQKIILDPKESR